MKFDNVLCVGNVCLGGILFKIMLKCLIDFLMYYADSGL